MVESARNTRPRCWQGSVNRQIFAGWALLLALLLPPAALAADPAPVGSSSKRHAAYLDMLRSTASARLAAKLDTVNRFFNAMRYRSDREARGLEDHWSTLGELLALGAGDCEDLAIGKYFALRTLGIPESTLRIAYVMDVTRQRPHMVLVHRGHDGRSRVLDNRSDRLSSLPERPDLVPIYEFNERQVTVVAPGGARHSFAHAGPRRIRQWDSLLTRAAAATRVTGEVSLRSPAPRYH